MEEIAMKKRMKWIACQMAAVMVAGCTVTGSVMAEESTEISEGMFAWFLVQAYDDACSINGGKTDLWENEIEGQSAEEWIAETAKTYTREYLAAKKKFEEQGMELTEEEEELIDTTVERYWNELGYGRYYQDYGITEENFKDFLTNSQQVSRLYTDASEELEKNITEEEIASYIDEHGNLVEYIAVPYTETLDEDAIEEEKEAWVDTDAIYEEYKERLEQGEDMEDLIQEVSESEENQELGISSSYSQTASETLFLDSNTSLSNGFKAALEEAEENEIIYFDDEAQYYQIIFVKKPLSADWEGLDQYRENITILIAIEKFEDQLREWSSEIEIANESELIGTDEIQAMFE